MKKYMKRLIIIALCVAVLGGIIPYNDVDVYADTTKNNLDGNSDMSLPAGTSPSASPSTSPSADNSEEAVKMAKKEAKNELKKAIEQMGKKVSGDSALKANLQMIKDVYEDRIDKKTSVTDVAAEKGQLLGQIASLEPQSQNDSDDDDNVPIGPSSSSDFILVGGDWVVPVVSYGQTVNIVLPVVNMGTENLKDVLVTPVVGNTVGEWPFILEKDNYTQTIPDLPGKLNGQNDMDRRRELTWTLRARADAMSGYYKLQFNVLYYVGAETESCTLTTYVHVLGAAGSGSIESEGSGTSTPRVIVTGFSTEPAKVYAGDTFKLTVHLKNTSQRTDVSNMLVTVSAPSEGTDSDSTYAAFLPTSGSNSSYISKISKGATYDLTIELTAKKDLSQKPYQLDVNMDFEDEDYASFTSNADVSIPIHQDAKFELNTPEVLPDTITVGQESNVMFSIYNTGRLPLINVKLSFEGDCVTGGEAYLGKVEAGGTGNVDVMVTGAAATTGEESVVAVLTYEDETGEQKTFKQPIKLTVTEEPSFDESMMMDDIGDIDYEDDVQGGKKPIIWIIVGSIIGIIVLIVIIVVIVKISKRKKEEKEMSSLLSDLEGEKDTDEIS